MAASLGTGRKIELELTPLLKHPAFGLQADLVQETKVGGAERPYATGNFYISITASPDVSVGDLKEYMSTALDASKGYAVPGPITNFRVKGDHLLPENEAIEATAKQLLGDGTNRLVMVAAPAPSLTKRGFPARDTLDLVNTDGHVG